MSVKKKSPLGIVITIVLLGAAAFVLYYLLVMITQAGPDAEKAASAAKAGITSENIANLAPISYDMLCDDYKGQISRIQFAKISSKEKPDEETVEFFEKLSGLTHPSNILYDAATYYAGTEESPITGTFKVKGIEYKVTTSMGFAPEIFTFEPKLVKWVVTIERITK